MRCVRWLYHVLGADVALGDPFSPPNLVQDGYIHCSFRDRAAESARLYFAADARVRVLQIDPRLVRCEVRVVDMPRGAMPHVHGPIPGGAIARILMMDQLADAPDELGSG